jgi:capsular exopolysaccharide synthesis family protein
MRSADPRSRLGPRDGSVPVREGGAAGTNNVESCSVGVPLGQVVPRTLAVSPAVVMLDQSRSIAAEKFWRLKVRLVNEYKDALRVIVVTSPAPREGKSFVALNLALAFAAEGRTTVLVDADLRRPTVHALMSPRPGVGLSEVLREKTTLDHVLFRLKNTPLRVLPGGEPVWEPVDLITSEVARKLFALLRSEFRQVIIDTPPIVPFTDADVLGGLSDGVLMVVRARSTPRNAYTQALSLVSSTRVLGVVLNDVTFTLADYGSYYHDYYRSYYEQRQDT